MCPSRVKQIYNNTNVVNVNRIKMVRLCACTCPSRARKIHNNIYKPENTENININARKTGFCVQFKLHERM